MNYQTKLLKLKSNDKGIFVDDTQVKKLKIQ